MPDDGGRIQRKGAKKQRRKGKKVVEPTARWSLIRDQILLSSTPIAALRLCVFALEMPKPIESMWRMEASIDETEVPFWQCEAPVDQCEVHVGEWDAPVEAMEVHIVQPEVHIC